jgi:proline dehydrogenase
MLNKIIALGIPFVPRAVVGRIAMRYIAGETLGDAVAKVRALNAERAMATIDVLGEFIKTREEASGNLRKNLAVLDALHENRLDANVSIKLTSLGFDIDADFTRMNVEMILTRARDRGNFVRIDMEDSPHTGKTLDLYERLRGEGFENTGPVIQSYMRRSETDVARLITLRANVRLCKGIYVEPHHIAFREPEMVRENYRRLLRQLLDGGCYVGIATHDEPLLEDALRVVDERKLPTSAYEFQMLLGVREERRRSLVGAGHRMRVYVPFGADWYGYSTRRLKENPKMAGYIVKAMFGGGK